MVAEWLPGLPPGPYYPGMELDYEVTFTVGGAVWHRPAGPSPHTRTNTDEDQTDDLSQ